MGHWDHYSFWIAQGFGLIGVVIGYFRTQQSDRRQYNLYHTYLCVPLMFQFWFLGAWFMLSLVLVGSIRTLLLSTNWGWDRRFVVVAICLLVPTIGSVYTATNALDWVLLFATIIGVGGEALKSFFHARLAAAFCTMSWIANSLFFGAYINILSNVVTLYGQGRAMNRDFALALRVKAFCGCQKSKLAYLQAYGVTSY